jgi:hypothetical protein
MHHLKPWIIGEDASDINAMWHRIFRKAAYLGPRGLPTAVVSGLDIALWDIKGKVTGRPVYDLLGGKVRPSIPTYANGWFFALDGFPMATTPEAYGAAAARAVAKGHTVVKCDPFHEMYQYHTAYLGGQITPEGEDFGINVIAAIREAVGPNVGVLLDAHGHDNVFLDHKLNFRGDQLFLPDRPGLGVDLHVELLARSRSTAGRAHDLIAADPALRAGVGQLGLWQSVPTRLSRPVPAPRSVAALAYRRRWPRVRLLQRRRCITCLIGRQRPLACERSTLHRRWISASSPSTERPRPAPVARRPRQSDCGARSQRPRLAARR